jgi:hypothetical protein
MLEQTLDINALEQREIERVSALMQMPTMIFVFGSNRKGAHGGGAAKQALVEYGAKWGVGEGMRGRSYALPTKSSHLSTLPISSIAEHVWQFIALARTRTDLEFAVTRVGCGLAGLTDEQVAPLFADAPLNCHLPEGWRT